MENANDILECVKEANNKNAELTKYQVITVRELMAQIDEQASETKSAALVTLKVFLEASLWDKKFPHQYLAERFKILKFDKLKCNNTFLYFSWIDSPLFSVAVDAGMDVMQKDEKDFNLLEKFLEQKHRISDGTEIKQNFLLFLKKCNDINALCTDAALENLLTVRSKCNIYLLEQLLAAGLVINLEKLIYEKDTVLDLILTADIDDKEKIIKLIKTSDQNKIQKEIGEIKEKQQCILDELGDMRQGLTDLKKSVKDTNKKIRDDMAEIKSMIYAFKNNANCSDCKMPQLNQVEIKNTCSTKGGKPLTKWRT